MENKNSFLIRFLKGFGIGIAAIIPGFSGGTLAIVLGIYTEIVDAISNLFKDFKNSFKILLPIGLGVLLGIIALIIPLRYALLYAPIPTVSFFVGLVFGSMPDLFKTIDKKYSPVNLIIAIITFAIAVGLCFIPGTQSVSFDSMNFVGYLVLLIMGIIGSCALVIPGISGSMVLLILGYWKPIRATLEELMKLNNLGHNFLIMVVFGVGVIIGFILISKLMSYLFKKALVPTYFGIIGFIFGSIIALYLTLSNPIINVLQIVLSVVTLALGTFVSYYLYKLSKHNDNKNSDDEKNKKESNDSNLDQSVVEVKDDKSTQIDESKQTLNTDDKK
jgi:putative membrane protein